MLITAAEVADSLPGLSPTDAELLRSVADTDSWIKRKLGRNFERKTYTETVRGEGHPFLFLTESPIRELVEVRIDPYGVFGDSSIISDLTQFAFDPDPTRDSSRLSWSGGWSIDVPAYVTGSSFWRPFADHARAAQVMYKAGWWAADDPDNVSDLPSDLHGRLVKRARVEFKRAVGVKDDETKEFDDEVILRELRHYLR